MMMKRLWILIGFVLWAGSAFPDVVPRQMRVITGGDQKTNTAGYLIFPGATGTFIGGNLTLNNLGTGGGGGGGGFTVVVPGNGIQILDDGGGTNEIAIDPAVVFTNGGFKINGVSITDAGSITISSGAGVTNVLDSAGGPFDLVGHTNQPTLLIKGLSNSTPSAFTITDMGTFLALGVPGGGTVVTNIFAGFGVTLAGGGTLSVDGTVIPVLASNNTFAAASTNRFLGPVIIKGTTIISNDLAVTGNLTVSSNVTATGTGSFGHFGAGQIDSGTLAPSILPAKTPTNMTATAGTFTWDPSNLSWGYTPQPGGTVVSNIFAGTGLTLASGGTLNVDGTQVGMLASNQTWTGTNTFSMPVYATDFFGTIWGQHNGVTSGSIVTNNLNLGGSEGKQITNSVNVSTLIVTLSNNPSAFGKVTYRVITSNGVTPSITFTSAVNAGITMGQFYGGFSNGGTVNAGSTNQFTMILWSNGVVDVACSLGGVLNVTYNNLTVNGAGVFNSTADFWGQVTSHSGGTLILNAGVWANQPVVISNSATITANAIVGGSLTVSGNATITGSLNTGTVTASINGANIVGNQTVGTNTLAAFGSNTGTIGSAGQFLVVHLNSAGIPDGWSTVTGSSLATSTNSISSVQLGGSWNNGVVGWSATNFSVATINGTTVTVGFASAPFENLTVLNGTTNFTLHGSSLTISNLLSNLGVTITNRGSGQIDIGGTVSMISNSANATLAVTGSSGNSTQNWSGSNSLVIQIPANGQTTKFIPNAAINGVHSEWDVVPQDGSNAGYLYLTRDGPKAGVMEIGFNDTGGGAAGFGHMPSGNATGDKRHGFVSSGTLSGGLFVFEIDGNLNGASGYQFYENDMRFPRALFTDNKRATDKNTPDVHETYASYGNWTNSGKAATLSGGGLIIIGSNEYWLAVGRAVGSVSGTSAKEYPTNSFSGFFFPPVTAAQSNQSFLALRDSSNGLWLMGIDANGGRAPYKTNDLSTPQAMTFATNVIPVINGWCTNASRGFAKVSVAVTSILGTSGSAWMFEYSTNTTGTVITNPVDSVTGPAIAFTENVTMEGVVDAGYALCVSNTSPAGASVAVNTESGSPATIPNRITYY